MPDSSDSTKTVREPEVLGIVVESDPELDLELESVPLGGVGVDVTGGLVVVPVPLWLTVRIYQHLTCLIKELPPDIISL